MGLIRILLALAVVSAHFTSHPWLKMVGGEVAVQGFFIISGFYIAMIFPKNYSSVGSFWKARFFRLYPAYLFCGLFAFGHPLESLQNLLNLPAPAAIFVFFTNATLLFQDATIFFEVNNHALEFVPAFTNSDTSLSKYLILKQAWSLGLEVSFYLIAPFIVTSFWRLLLLLLASICLRLILIHHGYVYDPWSYRFFPTELALFLLGSLSYKVATQTSAARKLPVSNRWAVFLLAIIILFIFLYPFIPWADWQKKLILYITLALSIPLIFSLTKSHWLDNLVGNLSYPVYCCHLIILGWISKIPPWKIYLKGTFPGAVLALLIVIGFSYLLYKYIETPFENYRVKYKKMG